MNLPVIRKKAYPTRDGQVIWFKAKECPVCQEEYFLMEEHLMDVECSSVEEHLLKGVISS